MSRAPYRVVDVFAGPGGLCEGFTSVSRADGTPAFQTVLSIEKEHFAHRTLRLRALFRQLKEKRLLEPYYEYVRSPTAYRMAELFGCDKEASTQAEAQAWHLELGPASHADVKARVGQALDGSTGPMVLVGGPPCQAYSLVGRSRMRGADPAGFEADHRHFLYREYLRLLADHRPEAFVMENVKGLLSARHSHLPMFERILADLARPADALSLGGPSVEYRLFALSPDNGQGRLLPDRTDYVLRAERHGVPQARHRVIIVGMRRDLVDHNFDVKPLIPGDPVPIDAAIQDLPRIRSRLSPKGSPRGDSPTAWKAVIQDGIDLITSDPQIPRRVADVARAIRADELPECEGSEFVGSPANPGLHSVWFHDPELRGVLNHASRGHIVEDLHRYLFASCFARAEGRSPGLKDFPDRFLPDHVNVDIALERGLFNDRFRVQRSGVPSTTITSHISKDGHYFVHPDPSQCRSLSVREAARLQTFPDNYFFEGPRTSQYVQVGNAVPPFLAKQIGERICEALDGLF